MKTLQNENNELKENLKATKTYNNELSNIVDELDQEIINKEVSLDITHKEISEQQTIINKFKINEILINNDITENFYNKQRIIDIRYSKINKSIIRLLNKELFL